jgi:alcohol dehydrogenase
VTITTGLVDTYSTPTLMSMLATGQLDTAAFVTHHYPMDAMIEAYGVFSQASTTGALKIALTRS